jgi:hypothetical protein
VEKPPFGTTVAQFHVECFNDGGLVQREGFGLGPAADALQ